MKRLLIYLLGKDARALLGLSRKHKLYVLYFGLSFCTLCIGGETPIWIVALIVLNFGNAVRLISRVPLKLKED